MIHGTSVVATGSTSGIGRGIARAFAAEGANVTLNGFGDQDAVEQERLAGLVVRADQQHAWVTQGDERGVYGEFSPAPV